MAKIISKAKFPLKLKDGAVVRDMEGLREHFDLELVLGYASSGKLGRWLNVWGMNQEAEALAALDKNAADYVQQLCLILGVETAQVQAQSVNVEDIEHLVAKKQRLKQLTADASIIAKAEIAAFDEAELQELLQQGQKEILLCNASFVIPLEYPCKYIGVGKAEAVFKEKAALAAAGIELVNVKYEQEDEEQSTAESETKCHTRKTTKKSASVPEPEGHDETLVYDIEHRNIAALCQWCEQIEDGTANVSFGAELALVSTLSYAAFKGDSQAMYGMSLVHQYGLGMFYPNAELANRWLDLSREYGYSESGKS